ncbi:MAG: DNA-binding protein [Lachnospiraceae bacterium]|nr:DNA-binding protein [Lachnospiraceae bacterium]
MNRILEQSLLYDFYGELLTEHQKNIYEAVVLDDYSLSEVAQEHGISRQGVHDLVKRCDKTLSQYEAKLHLVERFLATKELVAEIKKSAAAFRDTNDEDYLRKIEVVSDKILDEM